MFLSQYGSNAGTDEIYQTDTTTVLLELQQGQQITVRNGDAGMVGGYTNHMLSWFCGYMIAAL